MIATQEELIMIKTFGIIWLTKALADLLALSKNLTLETIKKAPT